jgi:hypothetical protein
MFLTVLSKHEDTSASFNYTPTPLHHRILCNLISTTSTDYLKFNKDGTVFFLSHSHTSVTNKVCKPFSLFLYSQISNRESTGYFGVRGKCGCTHMFHH